MNYGKYIHALLARDIIACKGKKWKVAWVKVLHATKVMHAINMLSYARSISNVLQLTNQHQFLFKDILHKCMQRYTVLITIIMSKVRKKHFLLFLSHQICWLHQHVWLFSL